VAIDAAKDVPLGERGRGEPCLQRADRALLEVGSERNGDFFSFALLVALGAADREHDAFALEGEVAELERGELAAAFVDSREAS